MLGTNPIAVAAPAGKERPFVLDMATSTVALGKVEVANRLGKPIPLGWVIDENSTPMDDAHQAFEKIRKRGGAGLLPLGGAGETLGGHKGYGLAMAIEILVATLAGARLLHEGQFEGWKVRLPVFRLTRNAVMASPL